MHFTERKEASLIGRVHCTTPSLRRSGEGAMMETGERSVFSRGWRQAGTNRRGTDSWVVESTQHGGWVPLSEPESCLVPVCSRMCSHNVFPSEWCK